MNKKTQRINSVIGIIALTSIGLFSLLYSLFGRRFAELHLSLPFLDFPVFMGEILLLFCFILLVWKISNQKYSIKLRPILTFLKCNWELLLLSCYFGFVLVKAICGYSKWGPLAFRHAALLYYPAFAVLSYTFYNKTFFSSRKILLLSFIFVFIPRLSAHSALPFNEYFLLTYFVLAIALIKKYPSKKIQYILFSLLLVSTPYRWFFYTSRTGLVSNIAAGTYMIFILPFVLRIKRVQRAMLCIGVAIFMLLGTLKITDTNAIKSLTHWGAVRDLYKEYNMHIAEVKDTFKMRDFKTRLYMPEGEVDKRIEQINEGNRQVEKKKQARKQKMQLQIKETETKIEGAELIVKESEDKIQEMQLQMKIMQDKTRENELQIKEIQSKIKEIQPEKEKAQAETEEAKAQIAEMKNEIKEPQVDPKQVRTMSQAYNHILFRVFIWQDMLTQLKEEGPLFGFDFGRPLRSRKVEIMRWGEGDWMGCGWITAHNSHLHIIYRTGIIGILFIITILFLLFKITKESIQRKSITEMLLCAALIYWLVAANFLVILELPYNAIPFWSLLGVTLAYIKRK